MSNAKNPKKILLRRGLKLSMLFANKMAKNGMTVTRLEKFLSLNNEKIPRCVTIKTISHAPAWFSLRALKACGDFLSHDPHEAKRMIKIQGKRAKGSPAR